MHVFLCLCRTYCFFSVFRIRVLLAAQTWTQVAVMTSHSTTIHPCCQIRGRMCHQCQSTTGKTSDFSQHCGHSHHNCRHSWILSNIQTTEERKSAQNIFKDDAHFLTKIVGPLWPTLTDWPIALVNWSNFNSAKGELLLWDIQISTVHDNVNRMSMVMYVNIKVLKLRRVIYFVIAINFCSQSSHY